jgi:hypothetical protein
VCTHLSAPVRAHTRPHLLSVALELGRGASHQNNIGWDFLWSRYQEPIPTLQLVRQLASVMQEYTQRGGVRPFGVSLLICGFDLAGKPSLFQVDPSVRPCSVRAPYHSPR